jgi:hypothetical protein
MNAQRLVAALVTACLIGGGNADAVPLAVPMVSIAPPFVIGAPGRLDDANDRREVRRYDRADSTAAAYADIEVVGDATWLAHEIELYGRTAFGCDRLPAGSCRRERRTIGRARVLYVARGSRAELLWMAGRCGIRVGWRRIVEAPTGTMTVEAPPHRFMDALLAEFPSELGPPPDDATWAAAEAARRRYYAEPWCSAQQGASSENAPILINAP